MNKILIGKPGGTRLFGELRVDGTVMAGTCEHGKEPLDRIKGG